mgnify:CR=1 FL=1|jgi:hypothetical protein
MQVVPTVLAHLHALANQGSLEVDLSAKMSMSVHQVLVMPMLLVSTYQVVILAAASQDFLAMVHIVQTLMNAMLIIHVIKMLSVRISLAVSHALASLAIQATGHFAQTSMNAV